MRGMIEPDNQVVKRELSTLLMAFDSFADLDTFSITVRQLQKDIRRRIKPAPTLALATLGLVDSVWAVKNGIQDLTRLLEHLEPNTHALDAYKAFLPKLYKNRQLRPASRERTNSRLTIDFEEERRTIAVILTGQDWATRVVTLQGPRGFGKSHLIRQYRVLAKDLGIRRVHILLKTGDSPHDCLDRMVRAFGANGGFPSFQFAQARGVGTQATAEDKGEWYRTLTEAFYRDLPRNGSRVQFMVLLDGIERGGVPLRIWLEKIFLPPLRDRYPLLPVLAARPECNLASAAPPGLCCRHVDLTGLTFQHAVEHIRSYALPFSEEQLECYCRSRFGTVDIPMPPAVLAQFFNGAQR